jgi:hypothetical protein
MLVLSLEHPATFSCSCLQIGDESNTNGGFVLGVNVKLLVLFARGHFVLATSCALLWF